MDIPIYQNHGQNVSTFTCLRQRPVIGKDEALGILDIGNLMRVVGIKELG